MLLLFLIKMKKEIDTIIEKYSQYLSEDIANLNIGDTFGKFEMNKINFDNAEFEEEITKYTKTIKNQIVRCKIRMLSVYKSSKRNDTYLLQNDKAFLSDLYFYLEYKNLLNINNQKEQIEKIFKKVNKYISNCWCTDVENVLEYERKGQMYSSEWLMKSRDIQIKSLSDTLDLKERHEELKNFTVSYFNLGEEIFGVLERVCDLVHNKYSYSNNLIKRKHTNINQSILNLEMSFIAINNISLLIRDDLQRGKTKLAKKEQQYIFNVIERMFLKFTDWFHTDLMKTEFKKYFEAFIKKIEDSISMDELKVIQSLNEDSPNNPSNIKKDKNDSEELKQEAKKTKPKFNPSQFNEYTHNLFTYILENYTTKGIVKYINIWYFLKRNIPKKYKEVILFNFTQNEYKVFVKSEFNIEIKKFKNSGDKFKDTEVSILHNCFKTYRENLK